MSVSDWEEEPARLEASTNHIAALRPRVTTPVPFLTTLFGAKEVIFMCPSFCLKAKRALACSCFDARALLYEHLHAPSLSVQPSDATWENAVYVACLPHLIKLCVVGETCLPEMHIAHYRTLSRLKVGTLGVPAAVFFGAAIANCDAILRLSDGTTVRALKPFREGKEVCLPPSASDADCLALLGAITLNRSARFLNCNRGSVGHPLLRAAWTAALVPASVRAKTSYLALAKVTTDPAFTLQHIFQCWWWLNDREVTLAAVRHLSPAVLHRAPCGFRADREIMLAAVDIEQAVFKGDNNTFRRYSRRNECAEALGLASEKLRADRELVLAAVRTSGRALQFAAEELRAERSIVHAALATSVSAIQYASAECHNDPEIMHLAGSRWHTNFGTQAMRIGKEYDFTKPSIYGFASEALLSDRSFVLEAVRFHPGSLQWVAAELRADREVALAALTCRSKPCPPQDFCHVAARAYPHVDAALRADRDFVLEVVSANGRLLSEAGPIFRTDRAVVLAAVAETAVALTYASNLLRQDRGFLLAAARVNGLILLHLALASSYRCDRQLVLAAVSQNGEALQYADDDCQADREVVTAAVSASVQLYPGDPRGPLALRHAALSLRTDAELIRLAGGAEALHRWELLGMDGACLPYETLMPNRSVRTG